MARPEFTQENHDFRINIDLSALAILGCVFIDSLLRCVAQIPLDRDGSLLEIYTIPLQAGDLSPPASCIYQQVNQGSPLYLDFADQALIAYVQEGNQFAPNTGSLVKYAVRIAQHEELTASPDDIEKAAAEAFIPYTPPAPLSDEEKTANESYQISGLQKLERDFTEAKAYRQRKDLPNHFDRPYALPAENKKKDEFGGTRHFPPAKGEGIIIIL